MDDLWFVSDVAGVHLLRRDFRFVPLAEVAVVSAAEWANGDNWVWAFHTEKEAQAFCNGYRACGGFVVPRQWGAVTLAPDGGIVR